MAGDQPPPNIIRVDIQPANVIIRQNIREPVAVPAERTQPSVFLSQHPYNLSEADFLRLTSPRSTLTSVGALILTFTVGYALPHVARLLSAEPGGKPYTIPATDLRVIVLLGLLALFLLSIGQFLSKERQTVLGRIAKHFRENPAHTEIRPEE